MFWALKSEFLNVKENFVKHVCSVKWFQTCPSPRFLLAQVAPHLHIWLNKKEHKQWLNISANKDKSEFTLQMYTFYTVIPEKHFALLCVGVSHQILMKHTEVCGCNLKKCKDEKVQSVNSFAGECMSNLTVRLFQSRPVISLTLATFQGTQCHYCSARRQNEKVKHKQSIWAVLLSCSSGNDPGEDVLSGVIDCCCYWLYRKSRQ